MMKLITEELLDTVTSQAKENSRLRMNYNFHASMDAPIHRLLNALEPGTYLPPHRHTDKEETYLVLRGSLLAFFYDDAGNVSEVTSLASSQKAAILVDNEGKSLSIEAGKAELPAKFAQLLKL